MNTELGAKQVLASSEIVRIGLGSDDLLLSIWNRHEVFGHPTDQHAVRKIPPTPKLPVLPDFTHYTLGTFTCQQSVSEGLFAWVLQRHVRRVIISVSGMYRSFT